MAPSGRRYESAVHAQLTPTEKLVLRTLLQQTTVVATAEQLGMRVVTARTHVRNIHSKTGTHSPAGTLIWAIEHWECCVAG